MIQILLDTFMSPKEKDDFQRSKIAKASDKDIESYLLIIYDNQTRVEKQCKTTINKNRIGFSVADCKILVTIAENYLKCGGISREEGFQLRRRLPKYWHQLVGARVL